MLASPGRFSEESAAMCRRPRLFPACSHSKKIALGSRAEIEEIHHLRDHFPSSVQHQTAAPRTKKGAATLVVAVATIEQRRERAAVSERVLLQAVP